MWRVFEKWDLTVMRVGLERRMLSLKRTLRSWMFKCLWSMAWTKRISDSSERIKRSASLEGAVGGGGVWVASGVLVVGIVDGGGGAGGGTGGEVGGAGVADETWSGGSSLMTSLPHSLE